MKPLTEHDIRASFVNSTKGEAKRMHDVCDERGVQLTFNHQRRFGPEFVRARELVREGAIVLTRVNVAEGEAQAAAASRLL